MSAADRVVTMFDNISNYLSHVSPFVLIAASVGGTLFVFKLHNVFTNSDQSWRKRIAAFGFTLLHKIPSIHRKVQDRLDKTGEDLVISIHECDKERIFIRNLPLEHAENASILEQINKYQMMDGRFDYKNGRLSGTIYTDIDLTHMELLSHVFQRFAYSNPLHPDVFPTVRKMEAEVVRIVANLFHAPPESVGTMTSGGTESIILACLSARNYALAQGITNPVVVVPVTAHPAFDKACNLLGIRIRHVLCDAKTGKVRIECMRRAVNANTCLLVGSAPNFPYGTIDDISKIAKLGQKHSIPVHVDACLGGFIVAFSSDTPALSHIPVFDFRLPGVTSISCDTHKYGYAPKGTSVLIYRWPKLLHQQYFCVTEWPGGIYATPTLAGSRAGLSIALTWATLLHFGYTEYARRAHLIATKTALLADSIEKIAGLYVVGKPDVSVVAFSSRQFNIHAVGDRLNKMGWNLNSLQLPDAIHFCLTYNQTTDSVILEFLTDLQHACEEVSNLPDRGGSSKTAAIYGMAAKIPDKSIVEEVAFLYLDACYSMPAREED